MKYRHFIFAIFFLFFQMERALAQDLDPRAYAWIPVGFTVLGLGYGYTYGGVITDPTIPVKDVDAHINTLSFGAAHIFNMFQKTAQLSMTLPWNWATVTGSVQETTQRITRDGLGDMRVRYSILLTGGPAATPAEIAKTPPRTIIGASLSVTVPTGQYLHGKLINLGTNRWSFKPELALSQPAGKRWLFDVYAGVWFFTVNNSFYPGNSVRSQAPLTTFQAHASYNITPRLWAAVNYTYYIGGASTVNDITDNDRQENSRVGGTLVLPVGKRNSIKIAYSTGAIIRFGANFSTISVAWNSIYYSKPKKAIPAS
ncbi:MAG TPA: transporter [Puia sp.]|nr:transporter [Puia sp.]